MAIIFLDTNILGIITSFTYKKCEEWLYQCYIRGALIVTSDICDYEIRRSFKLVQISHKSSKKMKAFSLQGMQELDDLKKNKFVEFLKITEPVLDKAASIWAETQILGIPMTDPQKLDADSIICAHWQILVEENPGREVIIATTNIRHLGQFAQVSNWQDIKF